jgi:hypothetical protein
VSAIAAIVDRMDREMPGHNTVRQLKAEMTRIRQSAEALDRVRANPSPLDTHAAHAIKVAKLARKFDSEVTAMVNRTSATWATARNAIEKAITEKVNLKPNKYEELILRRFVEMKGEDRLTEVKAMIEGNRGAELAAIIDAPPFLSGLSNEQCVAFRQAMISKHAAEEVAEIATLDDVYNHVTSASRTAGNYVRELTDPGKLARIEREAADADEAGKAFDQAVAAQQ